MGSPCHSWWFHWVHVIRMSNPILQHKYDTWSRSIKTLLNTFMRLKHTNFLIHWRKTANWIYIKLDLFFLCLHEINVLFLHENNSILMIGMRINATWVYYMRCGKYVSATLIEGVPLFYGRAICTAITRLRSVLHCNFVFHWTWISRVFVCMMLINVVHIFCYK